MEEKPDDTGVKPEPKRVLLIAPQPFYADRGTPMNVLAMVRTLAAAGYRVDLLVFPLGREVTIPGVHIYRSFRPPGITSAPIGPSWRKLFLDVFLLLKALKMIFSERYDLVHGVEEGGYIACLITRLRRRPYIYDVDSDIPQQVRDRRFFKAGWLLTIIDTVEKRCVQRAAAVITVCAALTERIKRESLNVPVFQIEDCPLLSASEVNGGLLPSLLAEYKPKGQKLIVYTGNLEPYQGIDLLLRSIALLTESAGALPRASLLIVGGDEERAAAYRAKATELGIADSVRFLLSRPVAEMGTIMSLADVLVSPRIQGENTPLKIYTYMAAEKPIVATRISSHTQVLSDETAFLADAEPAPFARALAAAMADDDPSSAASPRARAESAKQLVETRYSEDRFATALRAVYASILGPEAASEANAEHAPAKSCPFTGQTASAGNVNPLALGYVLPIFF